MLQSLSMSHCEALSVLDLLAVVQRRTTLSVLHLERLSTLSFSALGEEDGRRESEMEREAKELCWQFQGIAARQDSFLSPTDNVLRAVAAHCPALTVLCLSPAPRTMSIFAAPTELRLTAETVIHSLSLSRFPSPAESRNTLRMLIDSCPSLRALTLDNAVPFSDSVAGEMVKTCDVSAEEEGYKTESGQKRKRDIVREHCGLQSLRLRGNIFLSDNGLREMVLAMRGSLKEIDVAQCPLLSDDCVQKLRRDCPEVCILKW